MHLARLSRLCLFIIICAALTACGSGGGDTIVVNNAALPAFKDVDTAPPIIKTAARAVVRIGTAGSQATGFFISANGTLLTNDHVLGDSTCATEGCYIEIDRLHQRGIAYQDSETVYAVPLAVDNGLDMALVQLYNAPGGTKLNSPDFLTRAPRVQRNYSAVISR